ncbi:hypothetical protein phD2B_003 [Lelliottia phage phD2B]|uniref:Uncharacterized protein n=1 Tax=Lelliottia phage phD2B TaxID=1542498 RepID=A0A088FT46_9CAUD|nr:hypothetical protein phD2B_003 [Lelliottia phage phD2B]AIM51230.1 hypothetical protein phD2B_003 [Lelliottia phage phD2B]
MTTESMYDAKLSTIVSRIVWHKEGDKTIAAFRVDDAPLGKDGKHKYHRRVIHSRYFSSNSVVTDSVVDVVLFNNKRYLIDSQVEAVEEVYA